MQNLKKELSIVSKKNKSGGGQRGISVLLVVFIMSILLAIGLGISSILVQQTKMMGEIGYSVVSFFAADSGLEQHLYKLYKAPPPQAILTGSSGTATYEVLTKCGKKNITNCPAGFEVDNTRDVYFWTKSIGSYQKTKRAIEINY